MDKTQKILSSYGITLAQLGKVFPELEELIGLASEEATKATAGTLKSIDLQLSAFLTNDEAIKKLKKVQKKQSSSSVDDLETIIEKEGELGGLGSILNEDEIAAILSGSIEVEKETVKLLHRKTFVGVDISEFLTFFSGTYIPMVDENLNLIVRTDDLVIQAIWNEAYRAALQVSSDAVMKVADMRVDVVVSSYKKMLVDFISYGGSDVPTESVEEELPRKANDSEMTTLFAKQGVNGDDAYRFAAIKNEIATFNKDGLFSIDLPIGMTIHPHYTELSNYFYPANYLYSLEDCDRFEQIGLDSGSYISNVCDKSTKQRLTIYERGGNHLNITIEGMEESISNSASVDEQFESYVSPTLNEAFRKGVKAYLVGFQPDARIGSINIKDGGYFVYGANGQPNFMFIPAVIYNYFAKNYSFDDVRAYVGKKSSRVVIFERKDVVVGFYELPDELVIGLKYATRVFPINPKQTAEKTYGAYLSEFKSKIDLSEILGLQKEVVIEESEDDFSELIEDTEILIEIFIDAPSEELAEDIDVYIELLQDLGQFAEAERLNTLLKSEQPSEVVIEESEDDFEIEIPETEQEDIDIDLSELEIEIPETEQEDIDIDLSDFEI